MNLRFTCLRYIKICSIMVWLEIPYRNSWNFFAQIKVTRWVFMFVICLDKVERPQPTFVSSKDDLDSACLIAITDPDQSVPTSVPSGIRISLRQHSRWVRFLWILIQRKHMLRWKEVVDLKNPATTSWYGKSSIIYKVCYIPGRWDRDFWTINSICLRSCIDLTILILTSYGPWSWIQPRNHERIQILFFCWVLLWLRTQTHMENFSTVLYQQKSTSFQRIQPIVFLLALQFFISYLHIIYRSPLFFGWQTFPNAWSKTHCPGCLPFQDYNSSLYSGKYQMSPPEEVAPDRPDTGICTLTLEIPWVHPREPL